MAGRIAYSPNIQSAREFGRHVLGKFIVVFYDQVVSVDVIQYRFVAVLFAEGDGDPLLYFTSEKSSTVIPDLMRSLGVETAQQGSHVFCMFDAEGHSNYGASDDWADAAKFEQEVLKTVREGVSPPA